MRMLSKQFLILYIKVLKRELLLAPFSCLLMSPQSPGFYFSFNAGNTSITFHSKRRTNYLQIHLLLGSFFPLEEWP